jgi:hypothetical protein
MVTGRTAVVPFPLGTRAFPLFHSSQTCCGTRSVSYPKCTRGPFPEHKANCWTARGAPGKGNGAIPGVISVVGERIWALYAVEMMLQFRKWNLSTDGQTDRARYVHTLLQRSVG